MLQALLGQAAARWGQDPGLVATLAAASIRDSTSCLVPRSVREKLSELSSEQTSPHLMLGRFFFFCSFTQVDLSRRVRWSRSSLRQGSWELEV